MKITNPGGSDYEVSFNGVEDRDVFEHLRLLIEANGGTLVVTTTYAPPISSYESDMIRGVCPWT